MAGQLLDLRAVAYEVAGARLGVLPDALSLTLTAPRADTPTIDLSYPAGDWGVRADLLDSELEVAVEYTLDGDTWVEPTGARFTSQEAQADLLDDGTTSRKLSAIHVSSRLSEALIWEVPAAAQDADGKWNFLSATAGVILRTLWDAATARGWGKGLTLDVTTQADSAGQEWANVVTLAFDPTVTLTTVVSSLVDLGMCDVAWQGRTMRVYNPDTALARDRSGVVWPLHQGSTTAAPETTSWVDLCTDVLVKGEDGASWTFHNDEAPVGMRRVERIVEAGGVTLEATARLVAQATLASGATPAQEIKREWHATDALLLPWRDYQPGDWLTVERATTMDRLRVAQVSVTRDGSGTSGHTTFGTRLDDVLARFAKKTRGVVGAASTSGSGVRPAPEGQDKRTPAAPKGLTAAGDVVTRDNGFHAGLARLAWSPVTTATDATALEIASYELDMRTNTAGAPWWRAATTTGPTAQIDNLTAGATYQARVRARGRYATAPGDWSETVTVTIPADVTPPPTPSTPALAVTLGVLGIAWDGRGAGGEGMPADFDRVQVAVGTAPGTTEVWTSAASVDAQHWSVAGLSQGTWYVRLRALDTAGNASPWGAAASIAVTSMIDVDAIADEVKAHLDLQAVAQAAAEQAEANLKARLDSIDASLADAEQSVRDQMVTLSQAMTTVAEALVTTGPYPPDTGTLNASVWISPDARVFRLTEQGA